MATPANISDITQALAQLLELNVTRIAAGAVGPFTVSRLPPEKADEAGDTRLNIHLYHVAQDNDGGPDLPIGGSPRNPIATRPMPVKLFYVLTAHALINDNTDDVASQHALMGWAIKTLHDHGEIFADTTVDGTPLFDIGITLEGRGVEIIIRPLEPEDSISFWSTDQVRTARLSAFLEVRTLLLPPEPKRRASGIVADVALGVFGSAAPRLERSASVMEFTLPAALGSTTSRVDRDSAVAVLHAAGGSADARVQIFGLSLSNGRPSRIVLRGEPLDGPAVIEAAGNPSWNIDFNGSEASFEVRPSVIADVAGTVGPVDLVPGLYALAVMRERELATEDGLIRRRSAMESNRIPVALAPAITATLQMAMPGPRHIEIEVDPAFDVTAANVEAQLAIGPDAYRQVLTFFGDPAKDAGTFIARNAHFYEAAPAAAATHVPGTYPVRLSVNGIDAPPFWMEIP